MPHDDLPLSADLDTALALVRDASGRIDVEKSVAALARVRAEQDLEATAEPDRRWWLVAPLLATVVARRRPVSERMRRQVLESQARLDRELVERAAAREVTGRS